MDEREHRIQELKRTAAREHYRAEGIKYQNWITEHGLIDTMFNHERARDAALAELRELVPNFPDYWLTTTEADVCLR